jgi:hypothetical protein
LSVFIPKVFDPLLAITKLPFRTKALPPAEPFTVQVPVNVPGVDWAPVVITVVKVFAIVEF